MILPHRRQSVEELLATMALLLLAPPLVLLALLASGLSGHLGPASQFLVPAAALAPGLVGLHRLPFRRVVRILAAPLYLALMLLVTYAVAVLYMCSTGPCH